MSDLILNAKSRDLGGFSVARAIPQANKRQVGPFVFLDHMGPLIVSDSSKLDVRSHPHIGLSTVTYLVSGSGLHRDSLGHKQVIRPGDINWMTAGKGIVHSERTPEEELTGGKKMQGIQVWVALPKELEEMEPSFVHYPKTVIPKFTLEDMFEATLMIGKFNEYLSPVKTYSPMIFMDLVAKREGRECLSFQDQEIGIFLIEGEASINGKDLEINDLIVVSNPKEIEVCVKEKTRLIIIGGEPLPEKRFMWWNFVSSRKERIHQVAQDWTDQKFGKVMEEEDFIPLPQDIPLP